MLEPVPEVEIGQNVIEEQQENITFGDTEPAAPVEIRTIEDRTRFLRDDAIAHLGAYLSRPVLINTFTWSQSTTGFGLNVFYPWELFFGDSHIKAKLNNFARLQCTLRLKFILNASPFYYGLLKANYDPLNSGRAAGAGTLVRSQFPGVYIAPQDMSSIEMKLPFFWPRDYLDICSTADFHGLGNIDYNIFVPLASANSATTGQITISCYAWAEDVHLAAPTSYNALQGPVSNVARTVAGVAGAMAKVPTLAKLSTAVQKGAGMVSDLATALGFSNTPNMNDVEAVQVKPFHAFANTEQKVPLDKLTLDPKNEVTLSPDTVGLSDVDELAISEFTSHESLIGMCTWATSAVSGTHEMSLFVTPHMQTVETVSIVASDRFQMTPTRYLSRFFKYWRGSMIYRLMIVGTQYHKGRLQISWDPEDDASGASDTETTNITKIVDLDSEREIEFIVPFKAVRSWNITNYDDEGTLPIKYGAGAWSRTPNRTEHNGAISIFVQNQLSGPTDPTDVKILLFARAGPDFEVSVPIEPTRRYSVNACQGPETLDGSPIVDEKAITAFTTGERISSIRQLLHRTVCYGHFPRMVTTSQGLTTDIAIWSTNSFFPKMPRCWGYDSGGVSFCPSALGAGTFFPVNQVFETPLDSFTNCFAGYRGGVNWHVTPIFQDASDKPHITVSRSSGPYQLNTSTSGPVSLIQMPVNMSQTVVQDGSYLNMVGAIEETTTAVSGKKYAITPPCVGGASVGITNAQPFVSVNIPQYSSIRFQPAWSRTRDMLPGSDQFFDNFRVTCLQQAGVSRNRFMSMYVSAGVDFNLFYFVCCPLLWTYTLPQVVV